MHPQEKINNDTLSRQQLLMSLRGHTLKIPNLQVLFNHWPQHVNPELDRLRADVDERLQM